MINLTPIARQIQKRMFEKLRALEGHRSAPNNSTSTDSLTFDNLASRTTFIKMISNQDSPVTLMGGSLKDNTGLYSGYDIYSPRSYTVRKSTSENYEGSLEQNIKLFSAVPDVKGLNFETRKKAFEKLNLETKTVNSSNRPAPGVKSINVSFRGGEKALREAEISWVCWDFEELNLLIPHFLANGKTVLLEWGWIYGKDSLSKMNSLVDFTGTIKDQAFRDYSDLVIAGKGDFDVMVGIIKNFEFTTRTDGGFDCKTILTSMGHNIFSNPTPTSGVLDPGTQLRLSRKQDLKTVQDILRNATDDKGDDAKELLSVDTSVSLKLFVSKIDAYIKKELSDKISSKESTSVKDKSRRQNEINYVPNKYIQHLFISKGKESALNTWVKWGWFEDNVLDKFLGMTNFSGDRVITFRSVEKDPRTNKYMSVKIRNHPRLETTDIENHILPGQFLPQSSDTIEVEGEQIVLEGDNEFLKQLATIISDNFDPFNHDPDQTYETTSKLKTGYEGTINPLGSLESSDPDTQYMLEGLARLKKSNDEAFVGPPPPLGAEPVQEPTQSKTISKYGLLRNMLINTKILKEAFGESDGTNFSVESINVKETIEYMFDLINQDLDFWSFSITSDSNEPNKAMIIDENHVGIDLESIDKELGFETQKSLADSQGNLINHGVFYFPTWRPGSFVKSQNITGKIPDALALSAMYGGNMEAVREPDNPGNAFVDKSPIATGLLNNDSPDQHKRGLDIAFRNELNDIFARTNVDGKLKKVDQSVTEYLKKQTSDLEIKYETKLKEINEQIKEQADIATKRDNLGLDYDSSLGLPPPQYLKTEDKQVILKYEAKDETEKGFFEKLFSKKGGVLTAQLASKYDDEGRMKQQFIDGVGFLITNGRGKVGAQGDLPIDILLDLDLEIDGTGGILPGNSFNSVYLPKKYQQFTVFQTFEISHSVDSSGWTTSLNGIMRSSMNLVSNPIPNSVKTLIDNFKKKSEKLEEDKVKKAAEKKLEREAEQADINKQTYNANNATSTFRAQG